MTIESVETSRLEHTVDDLFGENRAELTAAHCMYEEVDTKILTHWVNFVHLEQAPRTRPEEEKDPQ